MTNTNKLRAKIVENGYTLYAFADEIGISRQSLSNKIHGKHNFSASEIVKCCETLKIARSEVGDYFFADVVPVLDT